MIFMYFQTIFQMLKYSKPLFLGKSSEDSVFDIQKFIICQKKTKTQPLTTKNSIQKIDATNKRREKQFSTFERN